MGEERGREGGRRVRTWEMCKSLSLIRGGTSVSTPAMLLADRDFPARNNKYAGTITIQ